MDEVDGAILFFEVAVRLLAWCTSCGWVD